MIRLQTSPSPNYQHVRRATSDPGTKPRSSGSTRTLRATPLRTVADNDDASDGRRSAIVNAATGSTSNLTLPAAFIGHGNPMNAVQVNRYTAELTCS